MCVTYRLFLEEDDAELEEILDKLNEKYGADLAGEISSKDIYPKSLAPVMGRGRKIALLRWGFGLKGKSGVVFNARDDSLRVKPMFRDCFGNRCLVPATAFFEWGFDKGKYIFAPTDRKMLYMAALWKACRTPNGVKEFCFTVITTGAGAAVENYHSRMPAVIAPPDAGTWLGGEEDEAMGLLRPYEGAFHVTRSA